MESIESIVATAQAELTRAESTASVREIESRFLGKNGELTGQLRSMGKLPADERPAFGQRVNDAKRLLEGAVEDRKAQLLAEERARQFAAEAIDVTMPAERPRLGHPHILQLVTDKIKRVLGGLGFRYVEGPEVEQFHYNFTALNVPADHPAMDDQDTFYIADDLVLRTQCTAVQGRIFETTPPPLRCFTVGRTYRNEAVDRTHSHTFHQVDCFMIDEGISMAHLKGTLGAFARAMFGHDVKIRFRPDFFPFVEPGVDYAISSPKLFDGRWVELGGAGLIHPNILDAYGIDREKYSGFAFGLGVERIPMMAYGVDDLRLFLENDLRFLRQFDSVVA
jgi:phenylalanyl-tRNA synthetase alpha chain